MEYKKRKTEDDEVEIKVEISFSTDMKTFVIEVGCDAEPLEINDITELLTVLSKEMKKDEFHFFDEDEVSLH